MTTLSFEHLDARVAAIRNLPICELNKRQPMLVELLVSIVDAETGQGSLTGDGYVQEQDWWNSMEVFAHGCGFKVLGSGYFSAAFSHEMLPGRVIKVGFKKEDSGAAYVAFCRMNQGMVGIPVIHDVQRHASCYTVVLDRLSEFTESEGLEEAFEAARDGLYNIGYGYEDSPLYGELFQTASKIREFFYGIASFDLHSGNVMVNDKGELIITDPVSFSEDREDLRVCTCDVDKLLKEIEAKAIDDLKAKARRRKENDANRIAQRKERRKSKKDSAKRSAALRRQAAIKHDWKLEGRHYGLFPTDNRFQWLHPREDGVKHVELMALKMRNLMELEKVRIAFNQPLLIDDVLQARLMG